MDTDFIDNIDSPEDLKKLKPADLEKAAQAIRDFMLRSVSKTGGHLASSLGVVELTVALHYVFDFKTDKLLWDVGHQCYAHKIITGRKDMFRNLRRGNGVSGFPNPLESQYDQFAVGHAGTAVPTALGMALAQQQLGSDEKIVAVVGDASIVNGISMEALNNLGLAKRQLLIILNDNSMAIDKTVGALAKYFLNARLSNTYEDLRKTTSSILEHTPVIGKGVDSTIEWIKKYIRMALPASQLFESMNVPYFGPVDGHDVVSMVKLFRKLAELDHPALLHIYTQKGKGFSPAADSPCKFHSTGPFEMNGDSIEDSTDNSKTASFTKVFGKSLVELANNDDKIVAITSAMTEGTGLNKFRQAFPDRFYDVGIAESCAIDVAAGLAKGGAKPVVCIYSTFLQRSFDQIFQEVSLQNLGVVFCVDRAGVVGNDGPTHHGLMDVGFLRMMPNMILISPADAAEVKLALEFALKSDKPVVIRYPRDQVPADDFDRSACLEPFEMGKSVTVRQGSNSKVAIISYGIVLTQCLQAAEKLSEQNVETDVINARFACPIDDRIISLIKAGKAIITVEDHNLACGFGSAILEKAATETAIISTPIINIGADRIFYKHDLRDNQLMQAGIYADNIVEKVMQVIDLMNQ